MFQIKLSKFSHYLLIVVVLLMLMVYFFPVWRISLGGRQFTEPLVIKLWTDKITGGTDYDIYTINDFNHYIGMKKLYPNSIPELKLMPYILGFMILGAVFTFFYNRLFMIYLGILNSFLTGIIGLYDFWVWMHDYGTNLDTRAPLYDSNVDFQPPIIGCKDILNVTTCSWPNIGAIFLFLAIGILFYILWIEKKKIQNGTK